MLRIISGEQKGRLIKTVEGSNTRPTSDRVKESLFNILQGYILDNHVLDLFSGTGNLGLEALSRGCKRVVFVEKEPKALSVLKSNCSSLGYTDQVLIMGKYAVRAIEELSNLAEKFDLIFMDPPYEKGHEIPVLTAINNNHILAEEGIVVVEHRRMDQQPDQVMDLIRYDSRKYGNICISFYRKG